MADDNAEAGRGGETSVHEHFTSRYFSAFTNSSRSSAEVVVPVVQSWVNPASVIDFGCGLGMWLSAWQDAGCEVRGVDGPWIDRSQLSIPVDRFTAHDLSQPYFAGETYDLAMSLEAADTIPAEAAAPFVRALTAAAPVVLFSAAAPDQPGTHHINSQWPAYWAELFAKRGYVVVDTLRELFWEDSRIGWWYRQNMMIYVDRDFLGRWPRLEAMYREGAQPSRLIHPELFAVWKDWGIEQSRRYWELRSQTDNRKSRARPSA